MHKRYIQNASSLCSTHAREQVCQIAEAGLYAIQTRHAVQRAVSLQGTSLTLGEETIDLNEIDSVYVVGVGKCALDAAYALEEVLGDTIADGVVVDVQCDSGVLTRIRSCGGTHPYPSPQNIDYTKELLGILEKAGERDIVVAIISGGASTLLCQPKSHTCTDEELLVQHLFKNGATIHDINIIRKHLSAARGGHMSALTYPARLHAFIFSDVPGDDLSTIASGPTVYDMSTVEDACTMVAKYNAGDIFDCAHFFETPKDASVFARTTNELIVTNEIALQAMQEKAIELGLRARVVATTLEGDAEQLAKEIVEQLDHEPPGSVLLYGGESTVQVRGDGIGGRNQHMALAALMHVQRGELVLPLASDGRDNSDFAGAIADTKAFDLAQEKGFDPQEYLSCGDSYSFFLGIEDGVITGYTGSNVSDLIIALKE